MGAQAPTAPRTEAEEAAVIDCHPILYEQQSSKAMQGPMHAAMSPPPPGGSPPAGNQSS